MTTRDDTPLLDAAALRGLLGQPDVLVVDCRHDLADPGYGARAYAAGHIPGAVFASVEEDLASPKRADTGRHPLPTPSQFAGVLGRWGFTSRSRVITYDQGNGAWAARLWWMLRSRGHRHVQVLDGGLAAWQAAGGALTTDVPPARAGSVEAREFTDVVGTAEVAAMLATGNVTLFDARPADRFAGRNETVDPVAGHVPGAISMPFAGNLGPDLHFLPVSALRERWVPLATRAGDTPLVAMCGSGVTACHNLLAMELAGVHGARLYVGSFSEWITDPARPVATEG